VVPIHYERILEAVNEYLEAGDTVEEIIRFMRIGKYATTFWESDPTPIMLERDQFQP